MIVINKTETPAQLAAQELVDKTNAFVVSLEKILTSGSAAEGTRPAVPSADLKAALGTTALAKLQAIVTAGA